MRRLCVAFLALAAVPSAASASCDLQPPDKMRAQTPRTIAADDLVRLRDIGPPAPSPDGGRVAFQMWQGDPDSNKYCLGLFIMNLDGRGDVHQIDAGGEFRVVRRSQWGLAAIPLGGADRSVLRWSPDGRSIAFLKRSKGSTQVWRADVEGQSAVQMTSGDADVEDMAWSEDSHGLVYAIRPDKGVDPSETRTGYLYDRRFVPLFGSRPRSLLANREILTVTDSEPAPRPAEMKEIDRLSAPWTPPSRSDRLRAVSQLGAVAMTRKFDGISADAGIVVRDRAGRETACVSSECGDGISKLWWTADGRAIRFLRREGWQRSTFGVYEWQPGPAAPRRLWATGDLLLECQPRRDHLLCLRENAVQPRDIVEIDPAHGRVTVLFNPNPEMAYLRLQKPRRLFWRNKLGLEAYGDLVLPPDHKAGDMHPLVIVQYTSRGFLRGGTGDEFPIQLLAAHGHAVLSVNRPADVDNMEGVVESAQASVRAWTDRKSVNSSLETGIDAAIALGVIDPAKIGITGLSDGAASLEFALLNSSRYSAGSSTSLSGRTCLLSLIGQGAAAQHLEAGRPGLTATGSVDYWRQGSISDAPEKLAVPLLLQVAEDEYLCAVPGYAALKELHKPVEMFVFPAEHHMKWQPAHRRAVYLRNVQWFDFWLRGVRALHPVDPGQYVRWEAMRR